MSKSPYALHITKLRRAIGNEEHVSIREPMADVAVTGSHLRADVPVVTEADVYAIEGGVEVRAQIDLAWTGECRRCLKPIDTTLRTSTRDIFTPDLDDEDTYPIVGEQIDLEPMIRDAVTLSLPLAPLCREDCAGLCPGCGVDRNESDCDCKVDLTDPRWAALEALRTED